MLILDRANNCEPAARRSSGRLHSSELSKSGVARPWQANQTLPPGFYKLGCRTRINDVTWGADPYQTHWTPFAAFRHGLPDRTRLRAPKHRVAPRDAPC